MNPLKSSRSSSYQYWPAYHLTFYGWHTSNHCMCVHTSCPHTPGAQTCPRGTEVRSTLVAASYHLHSALITFLEALVGQSWRASLPDESVFAQEWVFVVWGLKLGPRNRSPRRRANLTLRGTRTSTLHCLRSQGLKSWADQAVLYWRGSGRQSLSSVESGGATSHNWGWIHAQTLCSRASSRTPWSWSLRPLPQSYRNHCARLQMVHRKQLS